MPGLVAIPQIFSFLDAGNEGALDLVGIALSESEALEQLDTEVRADVVEAARLLQARRDAFARRCALDQTMSADEIPEVLLVDSEGFAALMEEVLRNSKGCPRPYLQPAPVSSRTEVPEYNYKPEMAPKSKELAAKRRPVNVPAHQVLLQEWEQSRHKREMEKVGGVPVSPSALPFLALLSEPFGYFLPSLNICVVAPSKRLRRRWRRWLNALLSPSSSASPLPATEGPFVCHRCSSGALQSLMTSSGSSRDRPSSGLQAQRSPPGTTGSSLPEEILCMSTLLACASRWPAVDSELSRPLPRSMGRKRTTRDSKAGASTEQGATLMELAGTVTHLDEGRVGSDPRLDSTEEMLKHLGDTDAAEFRNMERELQQILMQATDDEVLRLGTPGTGNTAVARGAEAEWKRKAVAAC